MVSRRKALRGGLGAIMTVLSGCISAEIGVEPRISRSYTSPARRNPFIEGQPDRRSEVPTIWGKLVTSKTAAESIDWDDWNPPSETKPYRETDFDSGFLSFIVAVLEPGHDILLATEPELTNGELQYEYGVTEYNENPDPEAPNPSFLYEVHKWELNWATKPHEIKIKNTGTVQYPDER